jgi:hypothetical protein
MYMVVAINEIDCMLIDCNEALIVWYIANIVAECKESWASGLQGRGAGGQQRMNSRDTLPFKSAFKAHAILKKEQWIPVIKFFIKVRTLVRTYSGHGVYNSISTRKGIDFLNERSEKHFLIILSTVFHGFTQVTIILALDWVKVFR